MQTRRKPTYHIVSHSHWDREWYFPFDRFRAMLVDMMEDLLDLFKRNPEFKSYTLDGQMAAVTDYLEVRPDRREHVEKLVRRKKLFIGPWYILNDEFLSSGESHIRNLLFGFRMGKSLGGVMKIGYIPDQFGHIAQMPQILQGFNIDTAMIYRGFGGEPGQEPSEYWWTSPDGSRVLMHHLPKDGYSAGYFGTKDEEVIVQKFERLRKELDARATTSQRVFFNGGDHHWPDEAVTTAIKVLRKKYDANLIHSNFVDYFKALKKEVGKGDTLKCLNGETRFGYRHAFAVLGGVFSSRMYLKQMNAASELLLERHLEPLNVLAMSEGMPGKTPQIDQAWKYVLQNQDHDAICGTSTDEVHQEMVMRYKKAQQIG
ncbi:MAG: Alpha-mann mid domain-containing protein, partial [Bacteroidetes bacterium]|nr:Alpha-mann mid domain-containing protein [Bacteroidota bacterium]